jgi:hypothetical protein
MGSLHQKIQPMKTAIARVLFFHCNYCCWRYPLFVFGIGTSRWADGPAPNVCCSRILLELGYPHKQPDHLNSPRKVYKLRFMF